MIFKTFDSDIDNISSKWGLFGKSFYDVSTDIKKRWDNVFKTLQDTNDYTLQNIANAWKMKNPNPIKFLADDEVMSILDRYNKALDSGAEATARLLNSGTGNEFMDDFLKNLDGAPATMDKYKVATKNATVVQKGFSASTIAAKAAVLALNIAVSMGLSIALSALLKTMSEVAQSEENLKDASRELGSELSTNASAIEDYKEKINGLKSVLSDSSSSFDDVSQARTDLMGIQDELIKKFGTEKGVIEDITEAIYGQTDALDQLSKDAYYKAVDEFNQKTGGDKFVDWLTFGDTDDERVQSNMDKMIRQMKYSVYSLKTTGNETLDNLIAKSLGLTISSDAYGDGKHFTIYGELDETQEKLTTIREIASDFDVSTGFENSFTDISNDVNSLLEAHQNLYEQYVLWEKILTNNPNNQYDEQYDLINQTKKAYDEAIKTGDVDAIQRASEEYSKTLSSAIDLAMSNYDYDVASYFEDMYPDMQQMFSEWKFTLDFEPNTGGLKDKVSNSLIGLEGFSSEDIMAFNPNVATEEQINAYGELNNVASEYGLTLQDLINLLMQMGLIQSESYQQMVAQFGQDNVNKIAPEDLVFAYQIQNVGDITFEEFQVEIQRLKEELLNLDETTALFDDIFSLKDADDALTNLGKISETIDTIQNAYKTLDDAIDEYNENGSFSIDTLQSVIGLGDDWLKYLVDEEGNLSLNKEALQELTRSRLEDMRIQTINNLIDNVGKIENETQALRYLTEANYDLGDSYEYVAAQSLQLKLRELENKGVSSDTISKIAKQSMSDMQKINDFFNNVDLNTDGSLGGSSGSSSSSSSNEDTYEELVDFFERRIEVLDDANSLLEKNLENVTGSFAKNNLIDSQLGIAEEKYRNYTDAISMYSEKAGDALSKLPADIAEKVKNGSVSMTDFIGDGNEDVVNAINDYQDWASKISDCKEELAALKETIRDLELNKFNNIIEDYTNQFDLYENANDLLSKQISLLEEAGELIGESFYSTQIEESQKQLSLLEEEKTALVNQLNSSLASGRIQAGTDEWLEMVNALSDVDGSILDCKTSMEELDNAILDLHTQIFDRIQEQFANLNSELENLFNLFDEDADVTDGKRNWTDEAIAQLGLLTQQYELSQYQIQQYDKEIKQLNTDYLNCKYSATEYADKLADLSSAQWDAVNSSEAIKDSIVELNETRVNEIIDGIQEEIDAYKELADSKIEALDAERDLKEYRDSIAEKSKSIADLEKQITEMQYDDTSATVAKRLQLEEQLVEAKKELEDAEYDHSIESQKDAINKQYEDYESIRNEEIEALEESLKDRETLIYNSFETVKANSNIIGGQIATIATQHGVKVSDSLISSWKSGENAIASYGTVLSQNSSAFIGNIIGIENEVLELQNKANSTANTLSYMFSTQADTLVSELKTSYNSEENLCNMTYALQDSLINTLERGYNINNIVNALDTIADKAKETWDSINGYDDGSQTGTQWRIVDKYGTYLSKPFDTQEEALSWAPTYEKTTGASVTLKKVKKYANGTRNAKNGLRIVNEEGYELTLPQVSSGNYTIGNAGDQILTKVETDNIFDWAKINPNMFNFKPIIPDTSSFIKKSDISPVSINYDSLIRVDGDVNNSNIKQIEAAVEAGIKKLSDNVNRNYRYGKR